MMLHMRAVQTTPRADFVLFFAGLLSFARLGRVQARHIAQSAGAVRPVL